MSYINDIYEKVVEKNPNEKLFHQAVKEIFSSIKPFIEKNEKYYKDLALLERITEPDRIISFRVPWVDDKGAIHVNKGYRVQFSSAIGPYKGGIRFHESVNQDMLKFLGFEQIFKNSLTGLPMGGGKGGSDFSPKGKSDMEMMRFCQSFMNELYKYIGSNTDVPAGDIGVGAREIGYMFGEYKKITGLFTGVLTGKGLQYGGSLARKEATGYGVVYMAENILKDVGDSVEGKKVAITGSGNVAIYAAEKFMELGAKVVIMSDSDSFLVDEDGIDLNIVKEIKEVKRGRIKEYLDIKGNKSYCEGRNKGLGALLSDHNIKVDIVAPCATQNEISVTDVDVMIKNNVKLLVEGANMPLTMEATGSIEGSKILYMPGKAANAGGVSVSGLEMSQNAEHLPWTFEDVDNKLKGIMAGIYDKVKEACDEYGMGNHFMAGANIAGFKKVAEALVSQGIV